MRPTSTKVRHDKHQPEPVSTITRNSVNQQPEPIGQASTETTHEGALAGALLMARIEEEARDLCAEFVRDARSQYRLTWSEIGAAFGITMQSAQWRFSRLPRKTATRLRR